MRPWIDSLFMLALGALIGAMLVDVVPGGIKKLEAWQTLITGVLAVGAAYVTLAEMRRAAATETNRLRATANERQNAERRWIERAISSRRTQLTLLITECRTVADWPALTPENISRLGGTVAYLAESVQVLLKSRAVVETSAHLSSDTEDALETAASTSVALLGLVEMIRSPVNRSDSDRLKEIQAQIVVRMPLLSLALHKFVVALDELAIAYGIDLPIMKIPIPKPVPLPLKV